MAATIQKPRSVMVQVDWPEGEPTVDGARALLGGTGVEIDETYRPVCVNRRERRFVFRGSADERAIEKARKVPRVRLFADPKIAPVR